MGILGVENENGSQPGPQLHRLVRLIYEINSNNTNFY